MFCKLDRPSPSRLFVSCHLAEILLLVKSEYLVVVGKNHFVLLADQFIACGKSRELAHELASLIWLAVIDNLEENEQTFCLLKRLAQEGDVSAPLNYAC